MLVLVGLGNPGQQYARQRHNIGFMAVDAIADYYDFSDEKKKFNALIREGHLESPSGQRCKTIIIKPQTYMNNSGKSVGELVRFFKLQLSQVVVLHDELDIMPTKLRTKIGGGNAGHNGLRSIDSHIGNSFIRVRIGIGHPGTKAAVHNYVLGDFSKHDQDWLATMLDAITAATPHLAQSGEDGPDDKALARFQSHVAQRMNPNRPPTRKPAKQENAPAPTKSPSHKSKQLSVSEETKSDNPFQEALRSILPKRK